MGKNKKRIDVQVHVINQRTGECSCGKDAMRVQGIWVCPMDMLESENAVQENRVKELKGLLKS